MHPISRKIETVLFWKAEPVTKRKLSEFIGANLEEVEAGLTALDGELSKRGIMLVRNGDEVMLGTAPELSSLIEKLTKEELNRELGKAGLETLSIILYFGPITRADIDFIRGVNSTFVLRSLMVRGLVERIANSADQRSFLYKSTFELQSYLGLGDLRTLPEYAAARTELEAFRAAQAEREKIELDDAATGSHADEPHDASSGEPNP